MAAIDFYFDFSSPYGYFAAMRIEKLAAKYEREVRWHPVLLGAIFKTTGGMPLTTIPVKGEYAMYDIVRTARFHDIPYEQPQQFPLSTQIAARAMMVVQQMHGSAKAVKFAKAVYRAYFVRGFNIADPAVIAQIATEQGIDPDVLAEEINSERIKVQLKVDVAQALARGVFGSPFFIVDSESFWGFDRFEQMEVFLRDGII
jgi:2-hydroxychromene-2-carboxylate isomerase